MGDVICCPGCHAQIPLAGMGPRTCPACGQAYEIKDGFIDFTPSEDFYWGEIGREKMARVNARAREQDWLSGVLEEVVAGGRENLLGYLLDRQRVAGLFHYYDPDENEACLDLGSGWGPISFGLSRYYRTVYSLDGVADRLTFQAIRARQDQVGNLRILKGSLLRLPLADESMSVVIVNGLLEWIGLSDERRDPREMQVAFLREVRRVLKPGGKIFIGIENRVGAQFFLGSPDHSGLGYTSLVPRWAASWMMRVRKPRGSLVYSSRSYRTYTYSAWGYRKLLAEAGFPSLNMYWTWPSYNQPDASGTLDGASIRAYLRALEGQMSSAARRGLVRALALLPDAALGTLIRVFSPHFLMVAGKPPRRAGLQERLLGASGGAAASFLRLSRPDRQELTSTYHLLDGRRERRVVNAVIAEEAAPAGRPVRAVSSADARRVASWMAAFQRENCQGVWPAGELEAQMAGLVSAARARLPGPQSNGLLDRFAARYAERMAAVAVPRVPEHGHLTPENLRVTGAGQVRLARPQAAGGTVQGHPFMDSGAFLLALLDVPGRPAAGAFEQAYHLASGLPLRLAPGYYLLRVIAREPADGGDDAPRRKELERALRYGLEE